MLFLSCNHAKKIDEQKLVVNPVSMDDAIAERIEQVLDLAKTTSGNISDSIQLFALPVLNTFFNKYHYAPVWSKTEKWLPLTDSLFQFIRNAEQEGLYPNDYHVQELESLKNKLDQDSVARMNVQLWTLAELLFTDASMRIMHDLKIGRLQPDSISVQFDLDDQFYINHLKVLLDGRKFNEWIVSLQPVHNKYWELKKGIKSFVEKMDRRIFTYVAFPFKKGNPGDSLLFIKQLQKRLFESNCIEENPDLPDSASLRKAILKYQIKYHLTADGKYGKALVASMNNNDVVKFKRIAINLDRYKQLPEKMPEKYIWVNVPGYYLRVINNDTVVFESKIICGKPETRTPVLNAKISDMIIYPTWTVPNSIIVKQYLPKLKNNPNYIAGIGLKLMNSNGDEVDPNTINWSKYAKGIPYKIVQGSGDNNSLGVIKFNFNNPYSVYLHDTDQRYLFKNDKRALSHGCVRVQDWDKLAYFIATNDSLLSEKKDSLKYNTDSIKNWIALKERRRIAVKNHIPLFIRYITCEGMNGDIKFYDDIYGEDILLMGKYKVKD